MEIIGISGKAGSGKDWLGREVLRPAGYSQFALSWPMKNEAVGHGFTWEEVHETKPKAVREWLQRRGTEEGFKKHGTYYWCNIAVAWLLTLQRNLGVEKFYISDIRFPHEYEFFRSLGAKMVRLEHGERVYPLAGTPAAEHESEIGLDHFTSEKWDARIVNDYTMTKQLATEILYARRVLPDQPELWSTAGRCCI